MVGLGRFELPTSPLSGVRSNQLSYSPTIGICNSRLVTLDRRFPLNERVNGHRS